MFYRIPRALIVYLVTCTQNTMKNKPNYLPALTTGQKNVNGFSPSSGHVSPLQDGPASPDSLPADEKRLFPPHKKPKTRLQRYTNKLPCIIYKTKVFCTTNTFSHAVKGYDLSGLRTFTGFQTDLK